MGSWIQGLSWWQLGLKHQRKGYCQVPSLVILGYATYGILWETAWNLPLRRTRPSPFWSALGWVKALIAIVQKSVLAPFCSFPPFPQKDGPYNLYLSSSQLWSTEQNPWPSSAHFAHNYGRAQLNLLNPISQPKTWRLDIGSGTIQNLL